ncbi:MAG: hypothetical protein KA716_32030 [Gloeotrichia echinulata DEX184]|nr:hypothetical protein [Gloeotrichia echinulata DEX184]
MTTRWHRKRRRHRGTRGRRQGASEANHQLRGNLTRDGNRTAAARRKATPQPPERREGGRPGNHCRAATATANHQPPTTNRQPLTDSSQPLAANHQPPTTDR